MKSALHMGYDADGVRRVARTLLRHVRPDDRQTAMELLNSRLGSYVADKSLLWSEVESHFAEAAEVEIA